MSGTTIASLQAVLSADTSAFTRGLSGAAGQLQGFGQRAGGAVSSIVGGLARAAVPLALLGGGAVAAATQWESAFTGVAKTVDMTDTELAELEAGLRALATSDNPVGGLANAHVELARIAEMAGQLGVANEDILSFTETIGMLTMATDLTADSASTMAARFANITGMDMSNIDNFGAALVALGNNSAATESEIMTLGMRLAAAGSGAGMSETDILGLSAAMKSVGIEAEAGGTAMSTTINTMTEAVALGGPKLQEFARVSGVSADEFATAWETDPVTALESFLTGLGEMDASEQIVALDSLGLSGIRTADTLRRLAGDTGGLSDALEIANTGWEENTALMDEANRRNETAAAAFERVKNKGYELMVTLGEQLLPAVENLIGPVGDVALGLAAIIAGDAEGGIATLTTGLQGLGDVLGTGVKNAADGVLVALENITGWELPTVDEGLESWRNILNMAGEIWTMIGTNIQTAIDNFKTSVSNLWNNIRTGVEAFANGITRFFQPVVDLINGIVSGIQNIIGTATTFAEGGAQVQLEAELADITPADTWVAGADAVGGQVWPARSYLVGEHGPELFTPDRHGYIVPKVGGGGNITVNLTAYGRDPYELYDMVRRAAMAAG